ncbi:MAG: SufD family Fe-S cluster assembly protein [Oscillospiraceae bacterium]|nr:SufD family Fe-S cluster assembly protein [Oscillospiraceae bacterium]
MAIQFDALQMNMLSTISDLEKVPTGAYNIRQNGQKLDRNTTANIDIVTKDDKDGIDIYIKPGTKNESVHIPVILSESGLHDMVYNDFHIGEGADVVIIAGCGIYNCGEQKTEHDGIHTFYCGKNSKVKYVEKHYGEGEGTGDNVLNPVTVCYLEEGAYLEMETIQIKGVDSTKRRTEAVVGKNATLIIGEKIFTHGKQFAETYFDVKLDGEGSHTHVVSRSVARDDSKQVYYSNIYGNAACNGHTECDAIIMDNARVDAIPEIHANNTEASLIHEAAIGKIRGEQLTKLMTLGLTEKEAEDRIIAGFMK